MKRFLQSVLLFLPISMVGYVLLVCLWGQFLPPVLTPNMRYKVASYGFMDQRLQEARQTGKVKLLFLGSSRTYRGFDPRLFAQAGLSSFNLGSRAQTPLQTKLLVKRYLETLQPDTVIFEVSPLIFMIDGVESSLEVLANDRNDRHSVAMVTQLKNLKSLNTMIYGFYHDAINQQMSVTPVEVFEDDTYVPGGFVQKDLAFYSPVPQDQQMYQPRPEQIAAFEEILALLKAQGVAVVLVQSPMTSGLYASYTNMQDFKQAMRAYAPFYDFNKGLPIDDSAHFYDANHLNQNGVQVFNRALLDTLGYGQF